ncbi:MAG TPA: hypothetical protein VFK46_07480 [Candidatus Macondimonas sp.]|nr:hypothetical protein [Candidatus Macondimonas sp.]
MSDGVVLNSVPEGARLRRIGNDAFDLCVGENRRGASPVVAVLENIVLHFSTFRVIVVISVVCRIAESLADHVVKHLLLGIVHCVVDVLNRSVFIEIHARLLGLAATCASKSLAYNFCVVPDSSRPEPQLGAAQYANPLAASHPDVQKIKTKVNMARFLADVDPRRMRIRLFSQLPLNLVIVAQSKFRQRTDGWVK